MLALVAAVSAKLVAELVDQRTSDGFEAVSLNPDWAESANLEP